MVSGDVAYSIEPLLGSQNYKDWSFRMQIVFEVKNLQGVIFTESELAEPSSAPKTASEQESEKPSRLKNAEAVLIIWENVSKHVRAMCVALEIRNARALWQHLEKRYRLSPKQLHDKYVAAYMELNIKSFEEVEQYVHEFEYIVTHLNASSIKHRDRAEMFFRNLGKFPRMRDWAWQKELLMDLRVDSFYESHMNSILDQTLDEARRHGL